MSCVNFSEPGINVENSKDIEVVTTEGKSSILEIKNLKTLKHLLIFKDYFRVRFFFFLSTGIWYLSINAVLINIVLSIKKHLKSSLQLNKMNSFQNLL